MSLSTNLVSGLVSGFDWRSMIDQLIEIEHRRVDLVENQKTEYESKLEIFQSINTKLLSLRTQAETLSSSNAFNVYTNTLSTDSTTYTASELLSVSTTTRAAPGSHTITMNANSTVAQARKMSSKSFASFDTALTLTGEFVINGRAVEVEDSDDLTDIREKINTLNSGANATGVTASILTVSSSNYRLILTSDNTGKDAFTIFDASTTNILSSGLGFTDGTTSVKNYTSNGFRSEGFSSSTLAVGSMLELSNTLSGTVTIGGVNNIDINLTTDSLTDIANEINTESGGGSVTASVVSTTEDGVTTYRLKIENTTSYTDDNNVLQALGLIEGNQGTAAEVHTGSEVLYADAGKSSYITATTQWDSIFDSDGNNSGVANNDIILIKGTKHDGSTVDTSFTIADNTWEIDEAGNSFLEAIETAFGLSAGSVTLVNGKIQVTDSTAGDSALSIALTSQNQGGGTLDFGTISATTEGYTMEVLEGQDTNIIIDGTAITSSSNLINDVIAGVTLNLLTLEELTGTDTTTVSLTISRDSDAIKSSVQTLLDQYNDVMSDINEQFAYDEETETAGLLQGDATLRSVKSSLVGIVTTAITGLPSTLNALSLIGITSDDEGNLSIDDDEFTEAFVDDFNGLRRIFVAEGSTTDGDIQYISHTNDTVAGDYKVNIITAATQAEASGSVDLSGGIASDLSTITITQGSKTAAITLVSTDNGSSIDNIVNAINSELDTEYAQILMGNVKNTTDAGQTSAITSSTTWDSVHSGGTLADLAKDDVISFTGHKRNGAEVSGNYTISNVATDTVQGLLSAIEAAFDYEVSAGINTYGYLVVTDNTTGNSSIDITITEPAGKNLNFGNVTTSNLVGSVRNTVGGNAIEETDQWKDIDGVGAIHNQWVYYSGYTANGEAVEGTYQINQNSQLSVFLGQIETDFGGAVDASFQDGRLVLTDGTTNTSLGIEILEPSGGGVDFGTLGGGTTGRYKVAVTASKSAGDQLVLTHDEYGSDHSFTIQVSDADLGLTDDETHEGVDVEGTINGEAATGSGQVLTGDAPEEGETSSVQGLTVRYTGTDTGEQGNVKVTMGVAELFDRALYDMTNFADGWVDYKIESMGTRIDELEVQIQQMEDRLDRRMELMINRFVYMETALSRLQNQSQWLAGQIDASFNAWGTF